MEVLAFGASDVPDPLRQQVDTLQDAEWPPPSGVARHGHDPALDPVTVVLVDDGRVVAGLDVLSKVITHRGLEFRAAGLSAVVTEPACRRAGLGRRLVLAARDLMISRAVDLGVFTCDPQLARFYRCAGWRCLPGTCLVGGTPLEPLRSDELGKVTMAAFFTGHGRAHEPEFAGCDIELYPGTVDRLW